MHERLEEEDDFWKLANRTAIDAATAALSDLRAQMKDATMWAGAHSLPTSARGGLPVGVDDETGPVAGPSAADTISSPVRPLSNVEKSTTFWIVAFPSVDMAVPVYYKPILGFVRAELIVNVIFVVLVLGVITLRVVARVNGPGLGWDDGLVLFAMVCTRSDPLS